MRPDGKAGIHTDNNPRKKMTSKHYNYELMQFSLPLSSDGILHESATGRKSGDTHGLKSVEKADK